MRFRQWLRRHESLMDWFAAWFGGSALTAFRLHNPDGQGWVYLATAVVFVGAGVTAHSIREHTL